MRILVWPHLMEIGGSQLNAVELAASVSRRGHEVLMFGPDGPLVEVARGSGLEYVITPSERTWPTLRNEASVRKLVTERQVEVVHGYEWGPAIDLALGVEPFCSVAPVTTVLSMSVPHFLPRHSTMIVGTHDLYVQKRSGRAGPTFLVEPPIDTERNAPRDPRPARSRFGLGSQEVVVAVVCRLTTDLDKLEGVLAAARVTGRLTLQGTPIHLLVAGEGAGAARLRACASEVNRTVGREVVTLLGGVLDPSNVYAAADIVLGMGSSALKGLAHGKPLIVQGARGFWRLLDESTTAGFLETGWFGDGGGGDRELESCLRALALNAPLRAHLGATGRALVVERFSLQVATDRLEDIYRNALEHRVSRSVLVKELSRTSYEFAKFRTVRLGQTQIMPRLRVSRHSVEKVPA